MKVPTLLTIAGSDSSGGAGIQADLRTWQSLGHEGATALTAITSQGPQGVSGIWPVPAETVREQVVRTLQDFPLIAIKVGMLANAEIAEVVADLLGGVSIPRVVDPVLRASDGRELVTCDDPVDLFHERIFPVTDLLTPNRAEAATLTGQKIDTFEDMISAGQALLRAGVGNVLVKGGHLDEQHPAIDVLVTRDEVYPVHGARVAGGDLHGSGCVLSAAIAAAWGGGDSLLGAVETAKALVTEEISRATVAES